MAMDSSISTLYDQLYRYCYFRLRDRELAQDTVQEAFTRYIDRYGSLDSRKAPPFLYTIARNICTDHYRRMENRARFAPGSHEDGDGDDPYSGYFSAEGGMDLTEKIGIRRALSRLPREDQELLLLVCVNGISVKEAAEIMGISRFAALRRMHRAKGSFREELKKEGLGNDKEREKT